MDLVTALGDYSRKKIGFSDNFISFIKFLYATFKNKIAYKNKINKTIKFSREIFRNNGKNKSKKLCLIFTSTTANPNHVRSELIFSNVMIKHGYDVLMVLSGGLYKTDEFNSPKEFNKNFRKVYNMHLKFCDRLVSSSNKKIIKLSSVYLNKRERELINKFNEIYNSKNIEELIDLELYGIKIHEHIFSTYCRQTLTAPQNINDIDFKRYKLIAVNVIKSIIYTNKILLKFKPSNTIAIHGIYLNHGPLVDLCKQNKMSLTIWGIPYRKKTYFMTKGDTYHRALMHVEKKLWNAPLTDFEKSKTISYLDSKESGGRDYWIYTGSVESNIALEISKIPPEKKIFTIFTNVMWDAQIFYKNSLFKHQIDWIEFTINTLKERDDVHIVIRIHPGEADKYKSNEALEDKLKSLAKNVNPDKLTIIKPNDSFSSYELLKISKLSLIFGSKISLESAYRNVPTIICGDSLFRQGEFTYLPLSRKDYKNLLLKDLPPLKDQKLYSIRFAHYIYFRVFREYNWAENLLDISTPFHKISKIEEEDLFKSILLGTS